MRQKYLQCFSTAEEAGANPRPETTLIKSAEGNTLAEVLGKIHGMVSTAGSGAEIRPLRKTCTGDVPVELGPGTIDKG